LRGEASLRGAARLRGLAAERGAIARRGAAAPALGFGLELEARLGVSFFAMAFDLL
jgi:hypothetical protein